MNYYYSADGAEAQGPYSLDDLASNFLSGALPASTQVCAEGTDTWQSLGSLIQSLQTQTALASLAPTQSSNPRSAANEISYVCPRCRSDNIQNVRLLYESGTSTSVSSGVALGVADIGESGYALVGGSGIQQTLLAERYAPPCLPKKRDGFAYFLTFAGLLFGLGVPLIMAFASIRELGPSGQNLCGIAGAILGIATVIWAVILTIRESKRYSQHVFPAYQKQLTEWMQCYVCHKCGYFGALE